MAVRNLLAIKSQVAPQNEFKVVDTDGNITINLGSDLVDTNVREDLASTTDVAKGAALVGYKHPGTGAVARDLYGKAQEVVSVLDFGAVGDGVADDTAALQAALNTLKAGVSLSLRGLTLKISGPLNVVSKSNFTLDGEGAAIIIADGTAVVAGKYAVLFDNCTDFTVKNLTVDGNRANRTPAEVYAHNIIFKQCQRFLGEQLVSSNAVVDGFYFEAAVNTDTSTYCRDFQIRNCFADNCYRQGASVINAYDFIFVGGAYTNSNGTAPEAGIDVESNAGATVGNTRGRFFGCRFSGNAGFGLALVEVAGSKNFLVDSCQFSANALGGIAAYTQETHIRGCEFSGHSGGGITQGIVTFPSASPSTDGSISGCIFSNNTNTTAAIYTHGDTKGIRIFNNKITNQSGVGITVNGSSHVVSMNTILTTGGIGISTNSANTIVSSNYIKAATGRGIYGDGARLRIINNIIEDVASVLGAYIQGVGNDVEVSGNTCIAASATSDFGVFINSTALSVHGNICVNLNSADPYTFVGSRNDEIMYNNIGGTNNDRRRVSTGMASPSFLAVDRPSASAVERGQQIFNRTSGIPNWSNGTDWVDATGTVV